MAVRSWALCAGRPLPQGRFLVLISARDWVDSKATVWLEGLDKLKIPRTSPGIETATFLCKVLKNYLCSSESKQLLSKCLRTYASYKQKHPFFSQNVIASLVNTVTCMAIAKQRLGKEASTTNRLFSMGSAPRSLLCNGSVNMFQQQRLCFLRSPCRGL
jgi:hypothetical protein